MTTHTPRKTRTTGAPDRGRPDEGGPTIDTSTLAPGIRSARAGAAHAADIEHVDATPTVAGRRRGRATPAAEVPRPARGPDAPSRRTPHRGSHR